MIRKAVLDSGVMFDALVADLICSDPPVPINYGRLPGCLHESVRPPEAQRRLLEILGSIRIRLTTSHAIGEVNGLTNSRLDLRGPHLSTFWERSTELLTLWNLGERLIEFLDLARREAATFPRAGIVDTGLVELAFRESCVLITNDERTLALLAYERGVDCRLLKNLI